MQTILPSIFILNSNCNHTFPPRFSPPTPFIHPHLPLAQGLLPPRGHADVEIILRPSAEDPRDLRDRFMLRAGASRKPVRRLFGLFFFGIFAHIGIFAHKYNTNIIKNIRRTSKFNLFIQFILFELRVVGFRSSRIRQPHGSSHLPHCPLCPDPVPPAGQALTRPSEALHTWGVVPHTPFARTYISVT